MGVGLATPQKEGVRVKIQPKKIDQDRFLGIDLVKVIAILFVVTLHFFLNTQFYSGPFTGENMIFQTYIRNFAYMAVPLFIIATGFLMAKKRPTEDYFRKIGPVIGIYLLYSIAAILFRITYLDQNLSFSEAIRMILLFDANQYSWYVKMYLGLYLLAPFINILYTSLLSQEKKRLIAVLVILAAVPPLLVHTKIYTFDFWVSLYPVLYYLIGLHIRNTQINIPRKHLIAAVVAIPLLPTLLQVVISPKNYAGYLDMYNSLHVAIQATAFFLLIYQIKITGVATKIVKYVSGLTLDIYLCSFMTDLYIYKEIGQGMRSQQDLLYIAPLLIAASFLSSLVFSTVRKATFVIR